MSNDVTDSNGRLTADTVRYYYVYILLCSDGKPYTGCTDNLKGRINRHQKGNVPATKDRLPIKIISYFAFSNKYTAYKFEKYLKSGSGRSFAYKRLLKQPGRRIVGEMVVQNVSERYPPSPPIGKCFC